MYYATFWSSLYAPDNIIPLVRVSVYWMIHRLFSSSLEFGFIMYINDAL